MFTVVAVEVLRSSPQAVFGLTLDKNMIVVDVEKSGSAADAGIQAGDVLVAIIDQPVKSLEEVNTAIQAVRGQHPNVIAMLDPICRLGAFIASTHASHTLPNRNSDATNIATA
jgi:membrane-associated protease RseP (regulator of RpoE activity)